MELTSGALLWTVLGLTVLVTGATVWQWPRLARPGWTSVLARLGALLTAQLGLVLVAALLINGYGDFYPTWDDLLGSDQQVTFGPSTGNAGDALPTAHGSRLVRPDGSSPAWPAGRPASVGALASVRVLGPRTGLHQQAYVYLPPQYFQPAYARTRFPVLVMMTGYPGTIATTLDRLNPPREASRLITEGRMQPTVLVLVSQNVALPRDTNCVDSVGGPAVETYFTDELPTALRSAYRLAPGPDSWAVEGYSEGGTCALAFGLRHPSVYGVVADLGGDYGLYENRQTGTLFGPPGPDREHLLQQADFNWRLTHLPQPSIRVLLGTAVKDRDYPATKRFLAEVRAPLRATPMLLQTGGHNFGTWAVEQGPMLEWISGQLAH
ncbi:S-formylglutathione hydrolase FrmB [Streptacidiphilus jiangxiensis]|uniref:S-formylglutathione hydrolase FrmB n=2 Tax=Streptacidiphilus jiangxiensis TaxID=235985 RepID=A0A1H7PZ07_STRJI|nr:S-formylglutathione hydrolase FrmB [Streptacidiphilus jiangxiensis]